MSALQGGKVTLGSKTGSRNSEGNGFGNRGAVDARASSHFVRPRALPRTARSRGSGEKQRAVLAIFIQSVPCLLIQMMTLEFSELPRS